MSLKEIAEEIVEAINETTNDYDAREVVVRILSNWPRRAGDRNTSKSDISATKDPDRELALK